MNCTRCGYDLRLLPKGACPECGEAFDPALPSPDRWSRGLRRFSTNTALALAAASLVSLAILWYFAWQDGYIEYARRFYRAPPGMRGNHGPWRHWSTADVSCSFTAGFMLAAFVAAIIGTTTERSWRAPIVALAIFGLIILLAYTHYWLVD